MATCPAGHESATTDYCDECGVPMSAPPPALRRCSVCHETLEDGARFCEVCGHDSTKEAPAAARWSVVVTADRAADADDQSPCRHASSTVRSRKWVAQEMHGS